MHARTFKRSSNRARNDDIKVTHIILVRCGIYALHCTAEYEYGERVRKQEDR